MWWLPVLNLLLITSLITTLAIDQSACWLRHRLRGGRASAVFCDTSRSVAQNFAVSQENNFFDNEDLNHLSAESLFQRAKLFSEWLVEYKTVQWCRAQAENIVESDLNEARFHLANAELFDLVMGDGRKGNQELDRADRYLTEAQTLTSDKVKSMVESIRGELTALRLDLGPKESISRDRLEHLKFELDRLIDGVHFGRM